MGEIHLNVKGENEVEPTISSLYHVEVLLHPTPSVEFRFYVEMNHLASADVPLAHHKFNTQTMKMESELD